MSRGMIAKGMDDQDPKDAAMSDPAFKRTNRQVLRFAPEFDRAPQRPRIGASSSSGRQEVAGTPEVQMAESPQVKRDEANGEMDIDDDGEAKSRRMLCLNFAGDVFKDMGIGQDRMLETWEDSKPAFDVTSDGVNGHLTHRILESQRERMNYVVHTTGNQITTDSTQVIAQLQIKGMLEGSDILEGELCRGIIKRGVHS